MHKIYKIFKNKKAEMPFWLMMLIYTIVGLVVILGLIVLIKGKMFGFVDWLAGGL